MLSPGKYHLRVPTDLRKNLRYRAGLLNRVKAEPTLRAGLTEMCRRDCLFYISTFVWQYNPKMRPAERVAPFIPWDFQARMILEILECVERQKPGVCEKSRELGATWLFLIVEDWLARFFPYTQIINLSRDADSVDTKSPGSLFGKLRLINKHLPDFLPGKVDESKMYHEYANGSVITGDASTGKAGVSDRATMMLLDEFAKVREGTAMRQGTAGTADARFFISTHEGEGTEFFRVSREPEHKKWVLHWTQHPLKNKGLYSYDRDGSDGRPAGLRFWKYDTAEGKIVGITTSDHDFSADYPFVTDGSPTGGPCPGIRSPWYDDMCGRIGDSRGVAMELDVDPVSSVKTLFEPILIRQLQRDCVKPYWEGDVIYDKDGQRPRLSPGINGPLKLWLNLILQGVPPAGVYKMGADVSGGTGKTPSCISIGDAVLGRKVGEYANPRIDPKEFGTLLVALGNLFSEETGIPAEIGWEDRGPGVTCGDRMRELHYGRLYRSVSRVAVGKKFAMSYGWHPEGDGKAVLLREYKFALAQRIFHEPSWTALEETLKFKYDKLGKIVHTGAMENPDPSGARDNHGDRATASAICWLLIKEAGMVKEPTPVAPVERVPYWFQTLEGRRQQAERQEQGRMKWA